MSYDYGRLRRLALIALVLQSAGSIKGRTKLQKIVYLVNLVGWNAFEFQYYNFGPYSDPLASEVDSMRNYGWINEDFLETHNERLMYRYSLARKRRQFAVSLIGKIQSMGPDKEKLVSRTAGLVRQLNDFASDDLEIMATLMFLSKEYPSKSPEDLINMTRDLKSQFSRDQIREGLRIFKIMRNFVSSPLTTQVEPRRQT